MLRFLKFILFFSNFIFILCDEPQFSYKSSDSLQKYLFWPNGTVPFFINPNHYDYEQMMCIMRGLKRFALKTCLQFAPTMLAPVENQHVLVFENPEGHRRCKIVTRGHSIYEPHYVTLGYDCLQSPQIDMFIMKALGFPFEHNRASRDVYIEVLLENIEPGSIELFTKDNVLPPELQQISYDVNSVMHFGERDYTKNGHRTFIFRIRDTKQHRVGLSPSDLRKIELVYKPECQRRDRSEKVEICQSYPSSMRRKRDITPELKSLRVNPDITPPPEPTNITITEDLNPEAKDYIKGLGIEEEIQVIVEHAYRVSALALKNARLTHCNTNNTNITDDTSNATDISRVIEVIADYAKSVVHTAISNLTVFCEEPEDFGKYQRQRGGCGYGDNSNRCRQTYRSTKSGPVQHSTQHRPTYIQSTKHYGIGGAYLGHRRMDDNNTDTTTEAVRNRRHSLDDAPPPDEDVEINQATLGDTVDINDYIVTHNVKWDDSGEATDCADGKGDSDKDNSTNGIEDSKTVGVVSRNTTKMSMSDFNSEDKKPETVTLNSNITTQDVVETTTASLNTTVAAETITASLNTTVAAENTTASLNITVAAETTTASLNTTVAAENTTASLNNVVSETPKEQSRRKRDVNSEDKKPEIVVLNSNLTVQGLLETTTASLNTVAAETATASLNTVAAETATVSLNTVAAESTSASLNNVVSETLKEQNRTRRDVYPGDKKPELVVLNSNITIPVVVETTVASIDTDVSETPKEHNKTRRDNNNEDNKPEIVVSNSNLTVQDNVETAKALLNTIVTEATTATLNTDVSETATASLNTVLADTTASFNNVVSVTPTEPSRTKRDVNTDDNKPETVILNTNTTVQKGSEVKETNSSKEVDGMTTKLGFMKIKFEEQRFFQGRRFRVQNPKGKSVKVEWDASAVSMEKTQHKKQPRQKNREEQEIKQNEQEKAKKKEERLELKDKHRTDRKRKVRNMTPKTVTLTKLNAEFYNERKWPGGDVRYIIAENPLYDLNDVRRRLNAVNNVLKRRTCVQLREVTEDEANNYEDFLVIDTSPDYVTGRVGGKQNFGSVELFRGGQHRQHAAMMAMAMLGFYFEVARHDRDKYIRVHMRHVRPDKLHHFEKIREEATLSIPYDYLSATHPAWQFWRKIGKTGISTVATYKEHDPDGSVMKRLGQGEELLSELDIVKINSVYGTKCFQPARTKRKKIDKKAEVNE